MAGRHSKRVGGPHVRIPAQRGPRPLRITDARTHMEHLVTDESLAAHRHSGRYLALCETEVLAASLTDPGPWPVPGMPVVTDPRVEISAACQVHQDSGSPDGQPPGAGHRAGRAC